MTKNEFLRISMNRSETVWGVRYFLFQTVFLSSLLSALNLVLPFSLNATQLNFLFFCINFGAALVIFRKFLVQFLQIDISRVLRILWVSAVFWVVYWVSTALLGQVFSVIDPDFVNQNDQNIATMTESHYWLMFIGTVILAPFAEECFHRGLIFRGLYPRSPIAAFTVSAAVFSAVHILHYIGSVPAHALLLSFLQYIPAGLCLAGAYRLSGSLISPILIHMAVNAMGMLALR